MNPAEPMLTSSTENRAASPFFRVFGGHDPLPVGDDVVRSTACPMHRVEYLVLATLVPLGIVAHAYEVLNGLGGTWTALIGFLPLSLIALHLIPLCLRIRSAVLSFWIWSLLLTLGSLWLLRSSESAIIRASGLIWPSFVALQMFALLILGWQKLMRLDAPPGIALRVFFVLAIHAAAIAIGWQFGWLTGLATIAPFVALWAWGTFVPSSQIFGPTATRVDRPEPLLTIDDGPDPHDTPIILDALDETQTKAVFFVIGEKVRAHPELAREIIARGHELGNHTMTHPQATIWALGPRRLRREILECQNAIREITGTTPRWFRPPVGHANFFVHPIARELGLDLVAWSRRAYDTRQTDPTKVIHQLTGSLQKGDIILVHEATPIAAKAIPGVLRTLNT